jgi:hypothetical protein
MLFPSPGCKPFNNDHSRTPHRRSPAHRHFRVGAVPRLRRHIIRETAGFRRGLHQCNLVQRRICLRCHHVAPWLVGESTTSPTTNCQDVKSIPGRTWDPVSCRCGALAQSNSSRTSAVRRPVYHRNRRPDKPMCGSIVAALLSGAALLPRLVEPIRAFRVSVDVAMVRHASHGSYLLSQSTRGSARCAATMATTAAAICLGRLQTRTQD